MGFKNLIYKMNKSNTHSFDSNSTRRKSSALSLKYEKKRKISAVSAHGLVLAHNMLKDGKDPEEQISSVDELSFVMKCIYTSVMFVMHFNFGLSLSSFAPSFVDFKSLLNTSMKYIGLFATCIAVGCVCGSVCGTLYKYLNRQLILALLISGMGAATIMMPYSSNLWHIYLCMFVYGFGIGAWNNSNNVWLMEMWQSNSPSVLMLSQSIYGVGTILGPLVVRPYLTGEFEDETDSFHNETNPSITHKEFLTDISKEIHEKLKTPYLITGCIQMFGPSLMFILFWIKKYHYTPVDKVVDDDEKASETDSVIPRKTLIALTSIFFATGFMTEIMYMDFAPTFFQFVPLRLPAKKAAEIASTMAIALAGGRALCIFVAMKLRPQYMIATCVSILWVGIVIQFFGQHILWVLWFSAVFICAGYSCIYVALYAFVNQFFEVTDSIGTIFILSYNSIYLILPFFLGSLIEEFPNIFIILLFTCVSIAVTDFAVILFVVRKIPTSMLRI